MCRVAHLPAVEAEAQLLQHAEPAQERLVVVALRNRWALAALHPNADEVPAAHVRPQDRLDLRVAEVRRPHDGRADLHARAQWSVMAFGRDTERQRQ